MEHWWLTARLRLRSILRRTRVEQELDEELQYHLERQISEELKAGKTPDEARYAALRAMGAIAKSKDESRDARRANLVEDFLRDELTAVALPTELVFSIGHPLLLA